MDEGLASDRSQKQAACPGASDDVSYVFPISYIIRQIRRVPESPANLVLI